MTFQLFGRFAAASSRLARRVGLYCAESLLQKKRGAFGMEDWTIQKRRQKYATSKRASKGDGIYYNTTEATLARSHSVEVFLIEA